MPVNEVDADEASDIYQKWRGEERVRQKHRRRRYARTNRQRASSWYSFASVDLPYSPWSWSCVLLLVIVQVIFLSEFLLIPKFSGQVKKQRNTWRRIAPQKSTKNTNENKAGQLKGKTRRCADFYPLLCLIFLTAR